MLSNLFKSRRQCIARNLRFFYDARTKDDTIFAPATDINSKTGSPLGVIRVSGNLTSNVIAKLTGLTISEQDTDRLDVHRKNRRSIIKARHAKLTKVIAPSTGELIDIGMVLWFAKPSSYTGEDVCEFHLHGSRAVITAMLDVLGSMKGLRPAEPGEFTRRAVLNGKMSLLQAESLPDLIASRTENQRKLALKGLDGSTRCRYEVWSRDLIEILAHLEASIDFGEDELIEEETTVRRCISRLNYLCLEIAEFIKAGTISRDLIQNGIRIAILGKPNVGKSTFMNLLCRREKSIVSDLSGTTRDIVEHQLEIGGHAVTLCDTAGLKGLNSEKTDFNMPSAINTNENDIKNILQRHDNIELEGMRRAVDAGKNCDVALYLIDGSKLPNETDDLARTLHQELEDLFRSLGNRKPRLIHVVINKIDLNSELSQVESENLGELLNVTSKLDCQPKVHFLSCITRQNFHYLLDRLTSDLNTLTCSSEIGEKLPLHSELVTNGLDYVNERHLSLLKASQRHLELAGKLDMETIDEMAQHVRESLDYLSRIVGSISNEQVFDVIFKDFCIGK